ncbi:MAG: hypothetical protein HRU76_10375 [Phycisphaeraceae bacterium]|nr:cell division protein FtsQ/DivIB [Phycisphaerales bacterium]QOJ17964.1 MAG: hypothetical protein HRU76_10375 [Phycisphaeraceae bacterium]
MRKKSAKKSKSMKDKPAAGRTWPRMPDGAVRGTLLGLMWIAGLGGLGFGAVYGYPELRSYAASKLSVEAIEIRLPPLPAWLEVLDTGEQTGRTVEFVNGVKARIIEEISTAARARLGRDPLVRGDLIATRESLMATGWFQSVDSIRRDQPGLVVIEATFVQPFTMVRDAQGSHLVDEQGRLLPLHYPAKSRLARLPVITGVRFARPSQPGMKWEGKDVAAALRLVSFLERPDDRGARPWLSQIVEVDASEYNRTEALWLTTNKGARLLWGRPPGEERGIEVPATTKFAYLEQLHRDYGRVDRDLRELDLVTDRVYAR